MRFSAGDNFPITAPHLYKHFRCKTCYGIVTYQEQEHRVALSTCVDALQPRQAALCMRILGPEGSRARDLHISRA